MGVLSQNYREFFQECTGNDPYDYQVKVGKALLHGDNVVLRAPTGAGKTKAVLIPFLYPGWERRPTRLIYALPLRSLAQGIYHEAKDLARKLGYAVEGQEDGQGREVVSPYVTVQIGEQPDDPFFDRGRIIVTTYDQILSGLLDGPYGLAGRLHNINAAAVTGSLVVFDEFHLMEPQKAFLTAVAGLRLFRGLCQSVWMTATATTPLEEMIGNALAAVTIPESDEETRALADSLPSVTKVTRDIRMETEPLSPESVLRHGCGRSIVLLNTVGRAQEIYKALREEIDSLGMTTSILLLHSRFFKQDREQKENVLSEYFGRMGKGSAILVATQVVEAGLDLTCEHLHTELCPMNSLVQRAGRCARFPGETGTVHVYPLPSKDRSWLPYGTPSEEDSVLTKTRQLLATMKSQLLDPFVVAKWVEEVHRDDDFNRLAEGWHNRLTECLRRVELSAIQRQSMRVADLIRGDDEDTVRVIVCWELNLPEKPGLRQGLNLRRGQIASLMRTSTAGVGWYWDVAGELPQWAPLRGQDDLNRAYVVCLRPEVAAYNSDIGLRLGEVGSVESPDRKEPPRPGHRPLRRESWADHSRLVAAEARRRWEVGARNGVLGTGFEMRYGLSPEMMEQAVVACALLHDLGKLQDRWQRWAEAAQRLTNDAYEYAEPLAHTDYHPESPVDWQRQSELHAQGYARPPHAPASAYYGAAFLAGLLPSIPEDRRAYVASACTAAIVAHHGGWLPQASNLVVSGLYPGWEEAVKSALPQGFTLPDLRSLYNRQDRRGLVQSLLALTAEPDSLREWWPLVAYLTRTLRLADQRATAEGATND